MRSEGGGANEGGGAREVEENEGGGGGGIERTYEELGSGRDGGVRKERCGMRVMEEG